MDPAPPIMPVHTSFWKEHEPYESKFVRTGGQKRRRLLSNAGVAGGCDQKQQLSRESLNNSPSPVRNLEKTAETERLSTNNYIEHQHSTSKEIDARQTNNHKIIPEVRMTDVERDTLLEAIADEESCTKDVDTADEGTEPNELEDWIWKSYEGLLDFMGGGDRGENQDTRRSRSATSKLAQRTLSLPKLQITEMPKLRCS